MGDDNQMGGVEKVVASWNALWRGAPIQFSIFHYFSIKYKLLLNKLSAYSLEIILIGSDHQLAAIQHPCHCHRKGELSGWEEGRKEGSIVMTSNRKSFRPRRRRRLLLRILIEADVPWGQKKEKEMKKTVAESGIGKVENNWKLPDYYQFIRQSCDIVVDETSSVQGWEVAERDWILKLLSLQFTAFQFLILLLHLLLAGYLLSLIGSCEFPTAVYR